MPSMRCRHYPRRLRIRQAFGVRLPAGAFGQQPSASGATASPQLLKNDRLGCSHGGTFVRWQASPRPRSHWKPRLPQNHRHETAWEPSLQWTPWKASPHEALWRVGFHPDLMAMIEWRARFHPGSQDRRGSSRFGRCTAGRPVDLCPIRFEPARAWRWAAGQRAL